MGDRLPGSPTPLVVGLATRDGGWAHAPVAVAATTRQRLVGLRPWPVGAALLLAGSSVHAHGMVDPLRIVGIDHRGIVVGSRRLDPGRTARLTGACFVLELPEGAASPPPGAALIVTRHPDAPRYESR